MYSKRFATRHRLICLKDISSALPIHALENGPIRQELACLSNKLESNVHISFPSFALIEKVLRKVQHDQGLMIKIKIVRQTQIWLSGLLKMSVRNPLVLPENQDLLMDLARSHHPLSQQNSLKLVTWTISGKVYRQREYQKGLHPLLQTPEEAAHLNIGVGLGQMGNMSHWIRYKQYS